MEFVLLLTIADAVAWLWNRMVTLERRIIELEGLSHVDTLEWQAAAEEPGGTEQSLAAANGVVLSRNSTQWNLQQVES